MRKQTKLVAVLSAAALLAIGASMTSFAASPWVQEGEDWVYLDKDGNRECNVWRRSNDNYYYLNEEGIMARDTLVKDDNIDAVYYVDENGVRVTNQWKELPNDEGAQVGSENTDDTPSSLFYYFGSSGKAYDAGTEDKKIREVDGKYYMFNGDGQMLSGWQKSPEGDLYYFGTEKEGWARIDWQQLEPMDYINGEDYDELEWFYFGKNGKASVNKSQYINGKYYHFDENGIMDDDWYDNTTTQPSAASAAKAFANLGGAQASGWVYTGDADLPEETRYDNEDMYWYYLVSIRENGKTARSFPYNYQVQDINKLDSGSRDATDAATTAIEKGVARAMVIKNKTYLFNADGKMFKGFVIINDDTNVPDKVTDGGNGLNLVNKDTGFAYRNDVNGVTSAPSVKNVVRFAGEDDPFGAAYKMDKDHPDQYVSKTDGNPTRDVTDAIKTYSGIKGRTLINGLYYFNETSGSVQGQMQTGRTAITVDGDTYYYYFSKDSTYPGYAYTNVVKDGYLYGQDGKCVVADDGNSYMEYILPENVIDMSKKDGTFFAKTGDSVIVSRTGKVKTTGTVTIDGTKYTIKKGIVTEWEDK